MSGRFFRLSSAILAIAGFLALAVAVSLGEENSSAYDELTGSFVQNEILIGLEPQAMEYLSMNGDSFESAVGMVTLNQLNEEYEVLDINKVFESVGEHDSLAVKYGLEGVYRVSVPYGTDLVAMIADYEQNPWVAYAELNRIYQAIGIPNDSNFSQQWALHNSGQTGGTPDADIDAPEAWDIETGDASVMIAIIDTGVNYQHSELTGGRVRTDIDKDFVNGDDDAMDDQGHGTFVAGIAAANSNNGSGIAGVCPGCQILPVKVLNSEGSGTAAQVAQGIQYAADAGAEILSMSLGFPSNCGCSETVARVINYAYDRGAFLVAASGNDSDKLQISYPSASSRVFSVGSSTHSDTESGFSNRSEQLDIVAPGEDIYGLQPPNGYRTASGTSAAAPHVAGVAGLVLSANPNMTNGMLWSTLYQSADDFSVSPAIDEASTEASISSADNVEVLVPGSYAPLVVRTRSVFGRLNAYRALKTHLGSTYPEVDSCQGEPSCVPGCPAEVSFSSERTVVDDLRLMRAFRDEVLATSSKGQTWIVHYEAHQFELAARLALDSELREQTRLAISQWLPLFRALVDRDVPEAAIITTGHLSSAEEVIDIYYTEASTQFRASLDVAKDLMRQLRPFIGSDVRQAWDSIAAPDN